MKFWNKKTLLYLILVFVFLLTACNHTSPKPDNTPLPVPPPEPIRKEFHFIAVGDNLIHSPIYEHAKKMGGDHYDFSSSYAPVKDAIAAADIAFLNQEVTVAGEEYIISTYPLFNAPKELAVEMSNIGFDIVNQASNHSMDSGMGALVDSWKLWKQLNVEVVGFYEQEAGAVRILERDGIRFAFLGYNYGLNGFIVDDWQEYGMTFLEEEEIILENVRHAKDIADFVIVSFHWGDEGATSANEQQEHLAHLLAQENVDVIIGHHPHVIQPVEILKRADGKEMPVFYSLGNFISNQSSGINLLGGMASLYFNVDGDSLFVDRVSMVPLVTHYEPQYKATRVLFLDRYTEEEAATHGVHSTTEYFSTPWLRYVFDDIIKEEFRGKAPDNIPKEGN